MAYRYGTSQLESNSLPSDTLTVRRMFIYLMHFLNIPHLSFTSGCDLQHNFPETSMKHKPVNDHD